MVTEYPLGPWTVMVPSTGKGERVAMDPLGSSAGGPP
jgi:hypothetical protein